MRIARCVHPVRVVLCLIVLGLLSATAFAQKPKTRDVSGVVLDVDARPVANATIAVAGAGGATATTGADGAFKLAVPVTEALIEITADGFTAKQVPLLAATTAVQLQVTIVRPVQPVTTRVVTGIVTDGGHAPLANARVLVQGTSIETVTATDGTFVLPGVATTDVTLEIEAPNQPATTAAVAADRAVVAVIVGAAQAAQPPPPPTSRTITGRVIDPSSKDPVAGAQVEIKSTGQIAFTEADGSFVFDNLPIAPVTLEITAAEHETRILEVGALQNTVDVALALAQGEQIVIEGRAPVIVKQNLANGASTIEGADLNRVSADTLDTAMTGKLAGANLQFNSGAPGGGAQLRLRGISTINGQSSPLYVVDGVIVSNVSVPSGANAITAAAAGGNASPQDNPTNRISDLNPNDIESVEVLKGASAAALYGSKASNGVVIITTKRGRNGENRMELTQRFGFSQVSNTLGSRHFGSIDEVKNAFCADPTSADCTTSPLVQAYMQANGKTYDHEAEITRTPFTRETLGSVSGGTDKGNYYGSMLIRDEPGVMIGTSYEKQSGRISVGYKFGDRLHLGFSANLIHSLSDRGLTNNDNTGTSAYVVLSGTPNFVDLQPKNGVYPVNPAIGSGANPLQTVNLFQNREEVWRLISGLNGSFDLYTSPDKQHEVKLLGNFGADSFTQRNALFAPNVLNFEQSNTGLVGTSIDGATSNLNFNIGSGALWGWKPKSGKFRSALSGGLTYETVNLNTTSIVAQNLTAGQPNVNSGTAIQVAQTRLQTKDAGLYAQEELALLDERLSVLAGVLGERSSLNGDSGAYFYYPKLAAVYSLIPKDEDTPGAEPMFETLRVRAAYGEAGNRPNYGQKFTPLNATTNIDGNAGVVIGGAAGDPNIEPERQREFELGTDAATKDERVAAELTVYERDISNLLLQRALATSTGFTTEFFNGGSLRNRGLEVALQVRPVSTKQIEWTTRGIADAEPLDDHQAHGADLRHHDRRVRRRPRCVPHRGRQERDPDRRADRQGWHGRGASEMASRISASAGPTPIKVGDFTLGALIDWQHGSSVVNLTRLLYDFGNNSPDTAAAGDRLTAFSNKDFRPYIEDASFVKLRELSITYNLPKKMVEQLGGPLRTLSINVAGRNLFTVTGYSGLDPEVSNFGNQPIGRNYDVAPYPTEPELLVLGHGGTVRMTMRKTITTLVLCAAVAGCNLDIGDLNNPSIDELQDHPTAPLVESAATGLLIGNRGNMAAANGYVVQLGILGREAYNFDQADPRYITELLQGPLSAGSPFGGNFWLLPYTNIRLSNVVLGAVDKVAELTAEDRAAIKGFAKTMQALDLLEVIVTHDTNGGVIDTDKPLDGPLGAIVDKPAVYAKIASLLDDATVDLDAAGATFPFALSSGFTGFDTPATFRTFNRAIRARVAIYTPGLRHGAHRTRRLVPRRHDHGRGWPRDRRVLLVLDQVRRHGQRAHEQEHLRPPLARDRRRDERRDRRPALHREDHQGHDRRRRAEPELEPQVQPVSRARQLGAPDPQRGADPARGRGQVLHERRAGRGRGARRGAHGFGRPRAAGRNARRDHVRGRAALRAALLADVRGRAPLDRPAPVQPRPAARRAGSRPQRPLPVPASGVQRAAGRAALRAR